LFKKEEVVELKDLPKVKPRNLRDDNMVKIIKESEIPVVVDCWADWCGPCKQIAPVIAELASEYNGRVLVAKLNTEKNRKMSQKYSVKSLPTILYFKDGKFITRTIGAMPKSSIKKAIEAYLLK